MIASIGYMWNTLSLGELDVKVISAEILADCGVDGRNLTAADIEGLFTCAALTRWADISWALEECLAAYTCDELSEREFGRATIVVCILVEAISRGHGCWDCLFDKMVTLICRNMDKGDFEFRMQYFRLISNSIPGESRVGPG